MVGKGAALWGSVDINEGIYMSSSCLISVPTLTQNSLVADLFIVLFDAIVSNPESVGHGREGYYFGSSDEHAWYQISKAIGKAMVELGLSKSDEPTAFSDEELVKYFGSLVCYFHKYQSLLGLMQDTCGASGWATTPVQTPVLEPTIRRLLAGSPKRGLRTWSLASKLRSRRS